jgi:hypothetical protein
MDFGMLVKDPADLIDCRCGSLGRVTGLHDEFGFDAVDMRAFVLDNSVVAIRYWCRPFHRDNWVSVHAIRMRLAALCLLAAVVLSSVSRAQEAPVFAITRAESSIAFNAKASVTIQGTFDRWDATLTFTSPDVTAAVLDVKVYADSGYRKLYQEQQA